MMRDLFLLLLVLLILFRTIGAPQAGVLGWAWLTLMTPQKLVWGVVSEWQLNLALAIVTFLAWFGSREPKRLVMGAPAIFCLLFMAFVTVTTLSSLAPELAWPRWSLAIKVMILGLVVAGVMTTQVRIHSLVWISAISLGFYGVKGGIFTLLTGGHFRVLAPPESFGDNNSLALALCMILPLMNYLRLQSVHRFVRFGIVTAMGFTVVGILGTYSRGGLVGLAIMGAYRWWHSRNRFRIALIVVLAAIPIYNFMPSNWSERMSTIQTADLDSSFQDRLQAWQTEFNIAKARPFLGGGFNASMSSNVYKKYSLDPTGWPRAAHSIYLEVLGDHGFLGLAIYICLLISIWHSAQSARRKARQSKELHWVADLAAMTQVSLVSFMVAGAALSMAYYDMVYLLLGITLVLKRKATQSQVQTTAKSSPVVPVLQGATS